MARTPAKFARAIRDKNGSAITTRDEAKRYVLGKAKNPAGCNALFRNPLLVVSVDTAH